MTETTPTTPQPDPLSPGVKSSEFLYSVVALLLGTALLLFGKDDMARTAGQSLMELATGFYIGARGLTKAVAAFKR